MPIDSAMPVPTALLQTELRALRLSAAEWLDGLGTSPSADRLARLEAIQWEIAAKALQCGVDVLLEVGPKTWDEWQPLRNKATQLGAETRFYPARRVRSTLTTQDGILEAPAMDEGW